jgi:hypothetical protein
MIDTELRLRKEGKPMKTLRCMLLIVPAIIINLASLGLTQATPATPATPASPSKTIEKRGEENKSKVVQVTGEVVSVERAAGTLTVKSVGKDLVITAQTRAAKKALSKIKAGESVTVNCIEKDGKLMGRSIVGAKGNHPT